MTGFGEPNLKKSENEKNENTGTLLENNSVKSVFFGFFEDENLSSEDFFGFPIVPKTEDNDFTSFDGVLCRKKQYHNNACFLEQEPKSVEKFHLPTTQTTAYQVPNNGMRKRDNTMSKLKRSRSLGDVSDPDHHSSVKTEIEAQNDLNLVSTINISKSPEKDPLNLVVLQDSIRKVLRDTIKSDHSIRNINMKIEVITTSVTREEVDKLSHDKDPKSDLPNIFINAEQKKEPEEDNISTISSLIALSSSREGSVAKDLADSPKSSKSGSSHIELLPKNVVLGSSPLNADSVKKDHTKDIVDANTSSYKINSPNHTNDSKCKTYFNKSSQDIVLESVGDAKKSLESEKTKYKKRKIKKKGASPKRRSLRNQTDPESEISDSVTKPLDKLDHNYEKITSVNLEKCKKTSRHSKINYITNPNPSNIDLTTQTTNDSINKRRSLERICKHQNIHNTTSNNHNSISDGKGIKPITSKLNNIPRKTEFSKDKTTKSVDKLCNETPSRKLLVPKCKSVEGQSNVVDNNSSETSSDKFLQKQTNNFVEECNELSSNKSPSESNISQNCHTNLAKLDILRNSSSQTVFLQKPPENYLFNWNNETRPNELSPKCQTSEYNNKNIDTGNTKNLIASHLHSSKNNSCSENRESLKQFGITKDLDVVLSPLTLDHNVKFPIENKILETEPIPPEIELESKLKLFKCLELQNVPAIKERVTGYVKDLDIEKVFIGPEKYRYDKVQPKEKNEIKNYLKSKSETSLESVENLKSKRRNSISYPSDLSNISEGSLLRSKSLACLKPENLKFDFKDLASSLLDVFAPMRITRSKVPIEYKKSTENMNCVLEGRKRYNSFNRASTTTSELMDFQDISNDEISLLNRLKRSKSLPRKQVFKSLVDSEHNVSTEPDDEELSEIDRKRKNRAMSESPEDRRKYQRMTRSRSVGRRVLEKEFNQSKADKGANKVLKNVLPKNENNSNDARILRSQSIHEQITEEYNISISNDSSKLSPRLRSKSVPRKSLLDKTKCSKETDEDAEMIVRQKKATEVNNYSRHRSKSVMGRLYNFSEANAVQNIKKEEEVTSRSRKRLRSPSRQKKTIGKRSERNILEMQIEDTNYKVGNLVWAQIGKFPFWPAMVCEDPISSLFVKNALIYKVMTTLYHVRFFNDNGKRAWIPESHLMIYVNKDDLTEMADKLNELKMKHYIRFLKPKLPKALEKWNKAVEELQEFKEKSSKEIYNHLVGSYVKNYNKRFKKNISAEPKTIDNYFDNDISKENKKKNTVNKELRKELKRKKLTKKYILDQGEPFIPPSKRKRTKSESKLLSGKKFPPIKIKIKLKNNGLFSELSSTDSFTTSSPLKKHKKQKRESEKQVSNFKIKIRAKDHQSDVFTKPKKVKKNHLPEGPKPKRFRRSLPAKLKQAKESNIDKTIDEVLAMSLEMDKASSIFLRRSLPAKLEQAKESDIDKTIDEVLAKSLEMNNDSFEFVRPSDGESDSFKIKKKKAQIDDGLDVDKKLRTDDTQIPKRKNQNDELSDAEPKTNNYGSEACKYSFEYQIELHRKNNPFFGMGRARVCHYCLRPGKLHKCKGKCGGVFHLDCASKVMLPRPQLRTSKQKKKHRWSGGVGTPPLATPTRNEKTVKISDSESTCSSRSSDNVQIVNVRSKLLTNLSNPNVPCLPPTFNQLTLNDQIEYRMKEVMSRFDDHVTYADSSTDTSSEEGSEIFLRTRKINMNKSPNRKIKVENASSTINIATPSSGNKDTTSISPIRPTKEKTVKHVTADSIIVDDVIDPSNFKCEYCRLEEDPPCGVCGLKVSSKGVTQLHKCCQSNCSKTFHKPCLRIWPQGQWSIGKWTRDQTSQDMFTCPSHVCHTCFSEELGTGSVRLPGDKLAKCLICPASYHASTFCLPAGSEVLGGAQIICPRHRKTTQPLNTSWCFICSEGGNLVCCDMCPTSVHPECQPVNFTDDDKYICEDCESGRFPLYDEVVWVKLGSYRWWPALVLFPNEVPENMLSLKHQIGDFAVRFFGTNDHYWVSKSRSFLFQEGDRGGGPEESISSKKKVYELFERAIEDAAIAYLLKKDFKLRREAESISSLKPPPYIKTVKNKPIGNVKQLELDLSNTTACECDPNGDQPCGPESNCLNRLLLTECDPELCPAKTRCRNQSFEKREYPPMVPYKTQGRGWGLRNLGPIRKGQFVIEYVGDLIDQEEYQRRIKKMHETKEENYYFMTLDNDRMIDAGPKGNLSRFMNHSCNPNCETQKWTVKGDTRVGLFALKDLEAGSELTFNYNLECIGPEKKTCKCGAPNCSGFIGAKAKPELDGDSSKSPIVKPKKLRRKKPEVLPLPPCFICGRRGAFIACSNKLCMKKYHLRCLGLAEKPDTNKYVCPRHNCNLCTNRTIRCCVKCTNSYCPSHSKGNIRHDQMQGFVCMLHDSSPDADSRKLTKIKISRRFGKPIKRHLDPGRASQREMWVLYQRASRARKNLKSNILKESMTPSTSGNEILNIQQNPDNLTAKETIKANLLIPEKLNLKASTKTNKKISSDIKNYSTKKRFLRQSLSLENECVTNLTTVLNTNNVPEKSCEAVNLSSQKSNKRFRKTLNLQKLNIKGENPRCTRQKSSLKFDNNMDNSNTNLAIVSTEINEEISLDLDNKTKYFSTVSNAKNVSENNVKQLKNNSNKVKPRKRILRSSLVLLKPSDKVNETDNSSAHKNIDLKTNIREENIDATEENSLENTPKNLKVSRRESFCKKIRNIEVTEKKSSENTTKKLKVDEMESISKNLHLSKILSKSTEFNSLETSNVEEINESSKPTNKYSEEIEEPQNTQFNNTENAPKHLKVNKRESFTKEVEYIDGTEENASENTSQTLKVNRRESISKNLYLPNTSSKTTEIKHSLETTNIEKINESNRHLKDIVEPKSTESNEIDNCGINKNIRSEGNTLDGTEISLAENKTNTTANKNESLTKNVNLPEIPGSSTLEGKEAIKPEVCTSLRASEEHLPNLDNSSISTEAENSPLVKVEESSSNKLVNIGEDIDNLKPNTATDIDCQSILSSSQNL